MRSLVCLSMACAPLFSMAGECQHPGDSLLTAGFERPPVQARYVAMNGSDAGDGSVTAPWATIQHAVDSVDAGDAICVHGGVYHEVVTISRSGSEAAGPIVLQSVPAETAVIDGTGLSIPDGQYGLVTLVDASHISVRDLELRNYATASSSQVPIGLYVTGAGTDIRLLHNRIHDIRATASGCAANAFGLKVDGTRAPQSINQLVIAGNEIHDLVLGCSETLSLDGNVEQWTIRDNVIHDTNNIAIGAIGFEGVAPDTAYDQARDGLIVGNTVYNISSFGNPAYGNVYAADGIYVDGGTRIVIERNRVHHVDIGIEVASEHAGRTSSDVTVRNNLVYFGHSAGISIGGYEAAAGGSERVTIVNNTLLRNDQADTGSGEFQIQYHASDNRFANNIVQAGSQGLLVNAFVNETGVPATLDNNLYWTDSGASSGAWVWHNTWFEDFAAYRSASAQDMHSLLADPLFVDATAPNVDVGATSPAIDAGADPGNGIAGDVDFAGHPRIIGIIDIGAYEH